MIEKYKRIVVLTGAGISAESGVPVFRGDDGLWQGRRVEEVATARAVAQNRDDVNGFFNAMRRETGSFKPNMAHKGLVEIEQAFGKNFLLVTQNIDCLHERAGANNLIHMHGELLRISCDVCGENYSFEEDVCKETLCKVCGDAGGLRPDIVLFGEMPKQMDEIIQALQSCDLFVAIGTSGVVYPAAGFVDIANSVGAHTIEINVADTERSPFFAEHIVGKASEGVMSLVERLVGNKA